MMQYISNVTTLKITNFGSTVKCGFPLQSLDKYLQIFDIIDYDILKSKLRTKIKDKDALNILDKIIDSTDKCIPIGSNTSQLFAIFYLDSIDKYIKEELKIRCYIRYQDDMLLFHHDKEYLKYCLKEIKLKLEELGMKVNKKTKIYKSNENINFIGVRKNKKYSNIARTRKKYKKSMFEYENGMVSLNSFISSKKNYVNRRRGVGL